MSMRDYCHEVLKLGKFEIDELSSDEERECYDVYFKGVIEFIGDDLDDFDDSDIMGYTKGEIDDLCVRVAVYREDPTCLLVDEIDGEAYIGPLYNEDESYPYEIYGGVSAYMDDEIECHTSIIGEKEIIAYNCINVIAKYWKELIVDLYQRGEINGLSMYDVFGDD